MRGGPGGAGHDSGEANAGGPLDALPQGLWAAQPAAHDASAAPGVVLRERQGGAAFSFPGGGVR